MTLWPGSLSGRLIIILLAGLLLAQAVSLVLHFRDRGQTVYRMGGIHLAERIVAIVHRLDSLEPLERRRAASMSSSRRFHVEIRDSFAPLAEQGHSYRRYARFVNRRLHRELGAGRRVDAMVSETPPAMDPSAPFMNRESARWTRHKPLFFVARVELPGGAADFLFRLPPDPLSGPERLLWPLLVLLGSVIILVLFAVRQTTRPLSMLSRAASRLGDDINEPPLPESGPQEVRNAARAFNRMQQKIQDYFRERSDLLAAVSHDLKTPITRMRIRAELLDDETLKGRLESDLAEMEHMVDEALDFVRGLDQREAKSQVDLAALIESLQDDFDGTGERIQCELAETAPYRGRPLALKRCLSNLIHNALKYGEHLTIRMTQDHAGVVIELIDDGPGLPEHLLERVFEPYYRVDPSRSRETGGSGLGLAIARTIARSHGGDVTLRNNTQGGLAATLVLPVDQSAI